MGFVRFACFLLVALPITSISIMKFHQEEKDAAQELDSFASVERELLSYNIGGRRLGMKNLMQLESRKSLGESEEIKVSDSSELAFSTSSSSSSNGSKDGKKRQMSSGSEVYNEDYMTYMHHPPKHN